MNDTDAEIVVTRDGPVTTLRLNRPEKLNAITPEMHALLQDGLDDFAADDSQRICVITGTGRAFCAGSDLKRAASRHAAGQNLEMPRSGYAGLVRRFDLDKPLIAAVNGLAVGGGFEMALCCDLIVASEDARFGLPEPHSGLVAIAGGPHRLARAIGLHRTMALALTGDTITAVEGRDLGFVNAVVPATGLSAAIATWCAAILRGGPLAISATKALVRHSLDAASLADAIGDQEALPAMRRWRDADERFEGTRAFAERRPPRWRIGDGG